MNGSGNQNDFVALQNVLAPLRRQLSALIGGDKAGIVSAGAALEQALEACGEGDAPVTLLGMMLQAMQALYQDSVAQPDELCHALDQAGAALEAFVEGNAPAAALDEAVSAIARAQQGTAQAQSTPAIPPAAQAAPAGDALNALEDISARLISLGAQDKAELTQVQLQLEQVCKEARLPEAVRDSLNKAGQQIGQVLRDTAGSAEAMVEAAAQAVAAAIWELEGGDRAADSSAAHEPVKQVSPEPAVAEPMPSAVANSTPAAAPAPAPEPRKADTLPMDADLTLLKEYIVECLDHINAAEASLLALESAQDSEQINTIFRAFHTIKGTSGFLGLDRIQRTAHLAENMLDRARSGEIHIQGGYADLALESCDALKFMISGLADLAGGDELPIPATLESLLVRLADPEAAGVSEEAIVQPMRLGDILVGNDALDRQAVEAAVREQDGKPLGEALVEKGAASAADVASALRVQKKMSAATDSANEASVRVNITRLDNLVNMVGELVIAQSMVTQDPGVVGGSNPRLSRNVSHAGKIIRELQDLTMSLRMVPLKATFQKVARLLRDLSRKSGKNVRLVTAGEETEIDRNMVEALNDPLIHMIRNAVDHGVESSEDRTAQGKDPTGTVELRAYHSAGNVVIELIDDGKGLDRTKIMAKAVKQGLIEAGREMSDAEAFSLIFRPGFSTAEKITDISGRGVGMDVVKRNVEAMHGRIDVFSKPGEGSRFAMRLPLTMAITDGMMLAVGNDRFLLPTVSIEQSLRPEGESLSSVLGKGELINLRGQTIPIFRLSELFGIPGAVRDPREGLLIVIAAEGRRCALMVDQLLGQQQVVIKSLGRSFGQVQGVAGAAILGDGRVGLILDAAGIMHLAHGESLAGQAA